jgi:protein arginine N-methyltransferase 1
MLWLNTTSYCKYLTDEVRLSAYQRPINATVRPGDVVLDLGSGTGILGLFACRAGAAYVDSIEVGSIIGLAREICRVNGFLDRVTYMRGLSTELELSRKVDVVVADEIGNLGSNVVWCNSSRLLENGS